MIIGKNSMPRGAPPFFAKITLGHTSMLLGAAKLLKETLSTSQPGTVPWEKKDRLRPTCVVFFVHGNIDVSLIEFGGLVHF